MWKTVSDQYGKYSFVKVISGNLKPDMQLVNSRTGATEKLGRLYVMKGKKAEEVKELECGDIGAIGKMEKVKTGDTLSDPRKVVKLEPIPSPSPATPWPSPQDQGPGGQDRRRPHPPERGGSDLQLGQQRRNPPDGGLRHRRHADGRDSLPAEEPLRRGRRALRAPVPYREKIRKKVEVQGRHKKQTGGHGQFGDVWMRFEPGDTEELQFCEEVVGGAVPKNYFPPWRRACGRPWFTVCWPATRWCT